VLESAFSLDPADLSGPAVARRQVAGWGGFDGLKVCARIGVEPGGLKDKAAGPASERYPDKNRIKAVLTLADFDYIDPGPQQTARAAKPAG
jgi:hypothetical protein